MEFFTYILARIMWLVLGALPLPLVVFLGRFLGILAWYCAPAYRDLVRRNLGIAFGADWDEKRRSEVGCEHFARLVGNFAAGACLSGVSVQKLMQRVEVVGIEHLHRQRASGRGVVTLIAHLGNWELLARLSPHLFQRTCGTVYQRLSNRYFDSWVRRQREAEGLLLFERKEGFHSAMDLLRKGGAVGVLGDQHAGDGGLWCPLFGRLASTTPLIATMALRTGSDLLALALHTRPGGRWRLVIEPFEFSERESTASVTCQLNHKLEQLIRFDPADWLWAHNRWKTPKPRFLAIGGKRGIHAQGIRQPFRLMVRSVNWLGDAVMMAPAVRAMRHGRPDLELTVVCPAKLAGFWRTVGEVDKVVELPSQGGIRAAAKLIRSGHYDAAVVFPNSLRTGLEVWLAGVPVRAGYPGHSRAWLLNFVCPRPAPLPQGAVARHQVYDHLNLAYFIGAPVLEEADWVAARTVSLGVGIARAWRIAVCPGAEYGPAKRWLPERFAQVIRMLSPRHAIEWTLVGVAKDAPVGAAIEAELADVPVKGLRNQIGGTSLGALVTLLQESDLLLTNDTGTMHLAASLGVPVVAVFGSTDAALTGPLGPGHRVLQHRVPCGPCFQRECHLDFACMRGVTAEEAAGAVESVLASIGAKAATLPAPQA